MSLSESPNMLVPQTTMHRESPVQKSSFAFPGAITTITSPQPGIGQISQGIAEHVEAENDHRQAKPRPECQRLFIPHPGVYIRINQVDEEIEQDYPGGEKEVDSGDHRPGAAWPGPVFFPEIRKRRQLTARRAH